VHVHVQAQACTTDEKHTQTWSRYHRSMVSMHNRVKLPYFGVLLIGGCEAHVRELMFVNGRLNSEADFKRARAWPCTATNQRCSFVSAEPTYCTNN
jgi:hypothetical protein